MQDRVAPPPPLINNFGRLLKIAKDDAGQSRIVVSFSLRGLQVITKVRDRSRRFCVTVNRKSNAETVLLIVAGPTPVSADAVGNAGCLRQLRCREIASGKRRSFEHAEHNPAVYGRPDLASPCLAACVGAAVWSGHWSERSS
tara:strand:+ start:29603 stop:30028 length:426 start_codon:yes stop_codon:yes gene_type:complete